MNNRYCVFVISLLVCGVGHANEQGYIIAYETMEMSMNNFRNFAGELGYRYDDRRQFRLPIMEVKLTERHLASDWESSSIDGSNVEGYLRGYELSHDWFFSKGWYYSTNVGYFNDYYKHTFLDAAIDHKTLTVGTGVGYTTDQLFGVDGLYLNFSIPIRYYFKQIKESKLGDTTVAPHVIVNNIWLFLGYRFAK